MSLLAELGFDSATAPTIDDAAAAVANNGQLPKGVYHAVLKGYRGLTSNETGNKGHELTFEVIGGPHKGEETKGSAWGSTSDDPKKQAAAKNKIVIWGHRLGLFVKDGSGKPVEAPGKHSFADCLGTPCFIEVTQEEEEWKDKETGKQRSMMKSKLSFEGILSPDDKKCKDVPKGEVPAGLAAAASASGSAGGSGAAAQPADKYAGL